MKSRPDVIDRIALFCVRKLRFRGHDRAVKWLAKTIRLRRIVGETTFGARMHLDFRDYVQYQILREGIYEPQTIKLIQRLLGPGDTFVDVGANVGLHTLAAAQIVGATGAVVSFEANPEVFELLRENIELNGARNIVPVLTAVSNRSGLMRFAAASEFSLGTGREASGAEENSFYSAVDQLHRLLPQLGIRSVDVLKIDVEGHELRVLEGLDFAKFRPKHILFEFFGNKDQSSDEPNRLLSIMANQGYDVRDVDGHPYVASQSLLEYNLWAKQRSSSNGQTFDQTSGFKHLSWST